MVKKICDLLNTTNITLGMSILVSVIAAIIVQLIFSLSKYISRSFKKLYIKISNIKLKLLKHIDYKKREKIGDLTTIELLLKLDPKDIEKEIED